MKEHEISTKKMISKLISVLFVIFAVIFGAERDGNCIGDRFLTMFGLKTWSDGTVGLHYTAVISLVFIMIAFVIYCSEEEKKTTASWRFIAWVLVIFLLGSVIL